MAHCCRRAPYQKAIILIGKSDEKEWKIDKKRKKEKRRLEK